MRSSEIKLPSNRKFGFFFTLVFAVAAAYFFNAANVSWTYTFGVLAAIFLFVSLLKADILMPLNKLWMRFGLLLSIIVSPIVLAVIYFGMFTPIGLIMRLLGRDELCLKFSKKSSHWIPRNDSLNSKSFKNQF